MEELNCHANILSARSPVFRAMFKVTISENSKSKVYLVEQQIEEI